MYANKSFKCKPHWHNFEDYVTSWKKSWDGVFNEKGLYVKLSARTTKVMIKLGQGYAEKKTARPTGVPNHGECPPLFSFLQMLYGQFQFSSGFCWSGSLMSRTRSL